MTHHCWGDDWPHWDDLRKAIDMLQTELRKTGCPGWALKEKFGTCRNAYRPHGFTTINGIIWPGYMYNPWPCWCGRRKLGWRATHSWWCCHRWAWWLDCYVTPLMFRWTGITWLTYHWQRRGYVRSYERVVRAFPHIHAEILCDGSKELLGHIADFGQWWRRSDGLRSTTHPTAEWQEFLAPYRK